MVSQAFRFKKISASFLLRFVFSILFIFLAYGVLAFGEKGMVPFLVILTFLMGLEWVDLCRITLKMKAKITFILSVYASLILTHFGHIQAGLGILFFAAAILFFMSWVTWRRGFAWLGMGILYSGVPITFLLWLVRGYENVFYLLIWVVCVVSANDIGGYCFGKLLRGPKLAKRISPNKTWAGFFGGVGLAMTVSYFYYQYFPFAVSLSYFLFLSLMMAVVAVCGDLLESAVKRFFGVKDSGTLLPGHGGIFDRMDGYLAVIPFVALIIFLNPESFYHAEEKNSTETVLLAAHESLK